MKKNTSAGRANRFPLLRPSQCRLNGGRLEFFYGQVVSDPLRSSAYRVKQRTLPPYRPSKRLLPAFLRLEGQCDEAIRAFAERFGPLSGPDSGENSESVERWRRAIEVGCCVVRVSDCHRKSLRADPRDVEAMTRWCKLPLKSLKSQLVRKVLLAMSVGNWLDGAARPMCRWIGGTLVVELQATCLMGALGQQLVERIGGKAGKPARLRCQNCGKDFTPERTTQIRCRSCIGRGFRQRDAMRALRSRRLPNSV